MVRMTSEQCKVCRLHFTNHTVLCPLDGSYVILIWQSFYGKWWRILTLEQLIIIINFVKGHHLYFLIAGIYFSFEKYLSISEILDMKSILIFHQLPTKKKKKSCSFSATSLSWLVHLCSLNPQALLISSLGKVACILCSCSSSLMSDQ